MCSKQSNGSKPKTTCQLHFQIATSCGGFGHRVACRLGCCLQGCMPPLQVCPRSRVLRMRMSRTQMVQQVRPRGHVQPRRAPKGKHLSQNVESTVLHNLMLPAEMASHAEGGSPGRTRQHVALQLDTWTRASSAPGCSLSASNSASLVAVQAQRHWQH